MALGFLLCHGKGARLPQLKEKQERKKLHCYPRLKHPTGSLLLHSFQWQGNGAGHGSGSLLLRAHGPAPFISRTKESFLLCKSVFVHPCTVPGLRSEQLPLTMPQNPLKNIQATEISPNLFPASPLQAAWERERDRLKQGHVPVPTSLHLLLTLPSALFIFLNSESASRSRHSKALPMGVCLSR